MVAVVTYHEEVVELYGASDHPLRALLTVPRRQRVEERGSGCSGRAEAALHRRIHLEEPQPEPALRVNSVVDELSERHVARAVFRVEGRAVRVLVHPVPEPEVCAAGHCVVADRVVRVCDPESGRRDVVVLRVTEGNMFSQALHRGVNEKLFHNWFVFWLISILSLQKM